MPIFEPGLDTLVATNVAAGRLSFTTDLKAAVAGADAVFIAVGTPTRRGDGHADLTYVFAASREIAEAVTGPIVIVTKSTVPVGTGDKVEEIMRELVTKHAVAVGTELPTWCDNIAYISHMPHSYQEREPIGH